MDIIDINDINDIKPYKHVENKESQALIDEYIRNGNSLKPKQIEAYCLMIFMKRLRSSKLSL